MCWRSSKKRLTRREKAIARAVQNLPPTLTDCAEKDEYVMRCRICFTLEGLRVSHIHGLLCESCLDMYKKANANKP